MNIWAWLLVGYFALEALVMIAQTGKPRKAATPGAVAAAVAIVGLLAVCVVLAAIS